MFLSWIDTFTQLHIAILRLFYNPTEFVDMSGMIAGGLEDVILRAFPTLRHQRPFYDQVWKDIYSRGLVSTDHIHTTMTGRGLVEKRTTDLGDMFVKFITSPIAA